MCPEISYKFFCVWQVLPLTFILVFGVPLFLSLLLKLKDKEIFVIPAIYFHDSFVWKANIITTLLQCYRGCYVVTWTSVFRQTLSWVSLSCTYLRRKNNCLSSLFPGFPVLKPNGKKQNTHTHLSALSSSSEFLRSQIPDGAEKSPQRHRQVTRDVILLSGSSYQG